MSTATTTLSVPEVRREAETYLKSLGARRHSAISWAVRSTVHPRRELLVYLDIRGRRTTRLSMERHRGVNSPPAGLAWMKANIWPYAYAHNARDRGGWNTLPGRPGDYSGTQVLTGDLLDVLRLWVPQELHWQDTAASPREAEPTREAGDQRP